MMRWLERKGQTHTDVHTQQQALRQRHVQRTSAFRMVASVQMGAQLILWVTFGGYDRAVQTVWQSALMLILPLAALWLVWRAGEGGLETKAGRYVPLILLPCLLSDALLSLYALCGFIDSLIPEYSYAVGAAAAAAVCWLTLLLSRRDGVAYGTSVFKYPLLILFLAGTVFLRSSSRADRLWPILGQGLKNTALAALSGAGSLWGAALLFALPGKTSQKSRMSPALWAVLPWAAGAVWALWYGFVRPWSPDDALAVGERMMGLARHASGIFNYQLAGLMWLVLLPLSLTGCAMSGEVLLTRAFPKLPRLAASGVLLLPAFLLVWLLPSMLPHVLQTVLPWRSAVSLAAGAALAFVARREAKR